MIHKYYLNGYYIVIDVNTSTVLSVDKIVFDILENFQNMTKEKILDTYLHLYAHNEIEEAIQEIEELIEGGMLFTEEDIEVSDINANTIKAMCLHIAHDCNLKCKYCFASQGDFKGEKKLMSYEVGKQAIDFLVEKSRNRKNIEIDFFGGEPLLNFDVVKQLITYAKNIEKDKNKRFKFTITTNGVLLDEDKRIFLDENMDNIVLSLDGRKAVNDAMRPTNNNKGSYDIVYNNVKEMAALREGKKDYYIRGTYTKHNLDFSKDVAYLADSGFKSISVEPVVAEPEMDYAILEEDLPQILNEYDKLAKDYLKRQEEGNGYNFFHFNIDLSNGPCVYKRISGCGAGNDYIAVTPEGDVYPCHQFVDNPEFMLGNVFSGIHDKGIRKDFQRANLLGKEDCKKCWCKYFCGGGCHANAYNFNGSIHKPYSVACETERRRVENAIMIYIFQAHH